LIVINEEITLADIDEALAFFREKVEDRYGNRLNWKQKELYWESINELLDARIALTEGNRENIDNSNSTTIT
jgi:hypothetical protein